MRKSILFALMLTIVGFAACKKCDESNYPGDPEEGGGGCFPPVKCADAVCTAQFVDVSVEVQHSSGAAARLDSFVVTHLSGRTLSPVNGIPAYGYPQSDDGKYSIMNDSWVQNHRNSNVQVIAKGYVNGHEVFREPFTIISDCCHVSKQSGKDVVIIP